MADEALEKLRNDYEDLFKKKPFNGWSAEQLQSKIDAKLNGGDDDKTEGDPAPKTAEVVAAASDPFPTQADLDAMRAGTYVNRELKSR